MSVGQTAPVDAPQEHRASPTEVSVVRMANDIARQFAHLGEQHATTAVADHVVAFWDPRMRAALREVVAAGGAGLDPLALAAARRVVGGADPAPTAPGADG